ncbi:YceI family protein [Marivirga atlantica]|jgi:polyisoprenoid-binding protein YceI|uniref:YceI family protein n=1 Tax=Marivirga atlantica TaxID=1548457 RepID=A0A937AET1_9BACT|nr:YceI family protein [Marivirga atlantica]MBL0764918.1 YceI family protein [Marivirga atlantica]
MKKTLLTIGLALAVVLSAFTIVRKELAVDTAASRIAWVGEKVTGQHNGTVKIKSGGLEVDGDQITGGSFVIDMTTIDVEDLSGDMKGKLMGHLRSDDFFSVEKHPTATFTITSVDKSEATDATHFISGDLTIKGKTNKVTFPATVSMVGGKVNATANFDLDRTKWDIRYGSGSFFDGLGDKMIYDDFKVDLLLSTK